MTELIVDLSNNNSTPDFGKLRNHGVRGVFLRCTEGLHGSGSVDPTFHDRWARADRAGLIVGAYHFAHQDLRPGLDGARAEAQHFIENLRKLAGHSKHALKTGNFKPVLDFEVGTANKEYSDWRDAFQQEIYKEIRHFTILYTYPGFNNWKPAKRGQKLFWVADYDNNPVLHLDGLEKRLKGRNPGIPGGYTRWGLWQFTSKLVIPGAHEPIDASILPNRKNALSDLRCKSDGR